LKEEFVEFLHGGVCGVDGRFGDFAINRVRCEGELHGRSVAFGFYVGGVYRIVRYGDGVGGVCFDGNVKEQRVAGDFYVGFFAVYSDVVFNAEILLDIAVVKHIDLGILCHVRRAVGWEHRLYFGRKQFRIIVVAVVVAAGRQHRQCGKHCGNQ